MAKIFPAVPLAAIMEISESFGAIVNPNSPTENLEVDRARRRWKSFSYTMALFILLLITLPVVNPWVHGDGVGYYAYVHSLLIDHNLQFENEWRAANSSFVLGRVGPNGEILESQYTVTHHLDNHFTVGPAILWAPFLIVVHLIVLALNGLGAHINSDGFGRPYLLTMAFATAGYGFCGLLLCFHLAREFVAERWAFLGVVGYWFASSLPVYMYLNPSWSHAHTLFSVALFLWYWHRTRARRTLPQWIVLGLFAALMVNVYYLNGVWLLIPAFDAVSDYFQIISSGSAPRAGNTPRESFTTLFASHLTFVIVFAVGMLPTLITRKIIYGGYLQTGYPGAHEWFWTNPVPGSVWFSSDHGLFTWTPILVPALIGLILFLRIDRTLAFYFLAVFAIFSYVLACYVNWDGISSFGNRFFISLGPAFIIGLAVLFDRAARGCAGERKAFIAAALAVVLFAAWNVGFIFQWGDHLIPVRGPISWRAMVYNQFHVVPMKVWDTADAFLFHRKRLLHQIEQKDNNQLQNPDSNNHP
jgi:hypothetical protein